MPKPCNDVSIVQLLHTKAVNEAKDNVKYLFTLENFLRLLYTDEPTTFVDIITSIVDHQQLGLIEY